MEKELKSSVSVYECISSLFHCFGASHQFDRYYKDGHYDDCLRQREELSLCMKLQYAGPEESRAIFKRLLRDEKSPTEGVVWEQRPVGETASSPAATAQTTATTTLK